YVDCTHREQRAGCCPEVDRECAQEPRQRGCEQHREDRQSPGVVQQLQVGVVALRRRQQLSCLQRVHRGLVTPGRKPAASLAATVVPSAPRVLFSRRGWEGTILPSGGW